MHIIHSSDMSEYVNQNDWKSYLRNAMPDLIRNHHRISNHTRDSASKSVKFLSFTQH